MFSGLARVATLLGMVAALVVSVASTAYATTWHTNKGVGGYSGAINASAGAVTLTGPVASIACTSLSSQGALGGPSVAGSTLTAETGSLFMSGCNVGAQNWRITCNYVFTANSYAGPVTSPALSGVASGTLTFTGPAARGCSIVRLGVEVCEMGGSLPVSYTNPSTLHGTDARFAVPAVTPASGLLQLYKGSGGTCTFGVGASGLTSLTFTSTDSTQPIIWQTNP
jgi:hypothetical protein